MVSRTRKAFRLQLLPLIAGFAVLAAIAGTRSLLIESQQADNIAVREAFELERHIVQTLSLVQDAETGQRGYLLTGEDPYLGPYQSAVEALPGELDRLKPAMADDAQRAAELGELKSAIGDKLKELADTIAMYQSGDRAGALAMVRDDRGKAYMDRVREVVANIRQNENAVLQARLAAADSSGTWLSRASIATLTRPAPARPVQRPRPAPPPDRDRCLAGTVDRSQRGAGQRDRHARDGGGAGPPDAEDGGDRPAHRRHRA